MNLEDRLVSVRDILQFIEADRFLDKRQAAEHCGVSVRTLESWKGLPRYKPSGKTLFKRSELDAFIERHREQSTDVDLEKMADDVLCAVLR